MNETQSILYILSSETTVNLRHDERSRQADAVAVWPPHIVRRHDGRGGRPCVRDATSRAILHGAANRCDLPVPARAIWPRRELGARLGQTHLPPLRNALREPEGAKLSSVP